MGLKRMLNNQYNSLVLGKSYLSFILSILDLKKGDSVLLLDDPRVRYGDSWYCYISDMERRLIKQWGERYDIAPLRDFDTYLTSDMIDIFVQGKIVTIGANPYRNLREFLRKFTDCFSPSILDSFAQIQEDDFIARFEQLLQNIVESAFETSDFKTIEGLIIKNDSDQFITFLNSFIDYFAEGLYQTELTSQHNHLIYILQSIFQTVLSTQTSPLVLRHLLLQALSKNYVVDESRLNNDLYTAFKKMGGDFKSTTVETWQIYQNNLSNVLLSSYEGVIGASRVYYMGGIPADVPFAVDHRKSVYSSFDVEINHPQKIFADFVGKRLIFSSLQSIGSDYPLWQAFYSTPEKCQIKYLYSYVDGSKVSFYEKHIRENLYNDFKEIIPNLDKELFLNSLTIKNGQNEWPKSKDVSNRNHSNFRYCQLVNGVRPTSGDPIKNVDYLGPLNGNPMGLYAFLIDLKRKMGWYTA